MTNLTELSKKVYQLQIEKGWCKPDEKRDIEDLKILILSEAFEAFEAYRKGNYCQLKKDTHFNIILYSLNNSKQEIDTTGFKELIKDTFEDEIADVAIRALDLAGYLGLDFQGAIFEDVPVYCVMMDKVEFPKYLDSFKNYLTNYDQSFIEEKGSSWVNFNNSTQKVNNSFIVNILSWCKEMANTFDFDLMQHIELKLAYNKTRPFRHGGKVV